MIVPEWGAPATVAALCTTREDSEDGIPAALAIDNVALPNITQVHGRKVVQAEALAEPVEADAVISATPGLACRVVTADCLPILLSNRSGNEVAAIHAGWRGLAADIVEATIEAMESDSRDLVAWLGPAISQAHFEVGHDVYDAFVTSPGDRAAADLFLPRGDKFFADLPGLARLRLARLGVGAVDGGSWCTYADARRFHSWRRDGAAAGRLVSVVCLRP